MTDEIYYELEITGGKVLVSEADFDRVNQYKWHVSNTGYAIVSFSKGGKNVTYTMQRLVTGAPSDLVVHHVNGDKLDNRRSNLRPVTPSENSACWHRPNNTSGYRGVTWSKATKRWIAKIEVGSRRTKGIRACKYLGSFLDPAEAARAYDKAAREAWGEYAILNFREEAHAAAYV